MASITSTLHAPVRQGRPAATLRVRILSWPEIWAALAALLVTPWHARTLIGDAAVYASTILDGRFFERSIHVGYYAVGWAFWRLLAPFGVRVDQALIALAPILAALAAAACWRFLRALGESRTACFAGMIVFALSGVMLRQATWPEIYALEMVLLSWSWIAVVRGRPWLGGIVFGLALLVTPLSAFGGGVFVWDAWRRRNVRPLAIVIATAVAVWAAVVTWCWHDYFWGTRGLLSVGPHRSFGWRSAFSNLVALVKNLHVFVAMLPFGLAVMAQQRDSRFGLVVTCMLAQTIVFLGMREDGVFLIALYPLLALAITRGLGVLWHLRRTPGGPALIGATAALYVMAGIALNLDPPGDTYGQDMQRFLRASGRNAVLIASWDHMMSFRLYEQLWGELGAGAPRVVNEELLTPELLHGLAQAGAPVFALEHFHPSPLARWLAPPAALRRRYEDNSLLFRLRQLSPGIEMEALTHHGDGPDFYRVRWAEADGGGAAGHPADERELAFRR